LGIETNARTQQVALTGDRLNGLWSPLGIETYTYACANCDTSMGLNGLWSPLGIETTEELEEMLKEYGG